MTIVPHYHPQITGKFVLLSVASGNNDGDFNPSSSPTVLACPVGALGCVRRPARHHMLSSLSLCRPRVLSVQPPSPCHLAPTRQDNSGRRQSELAAAV
jgi:hypothetical protein